MATCDTPIFSANSFCGICYSFNALRNYSLLKKLSLLLDIVTRLFGEKLPIHYNLTKKIQILNLRYYEKTLYVCCFVIQVLYSNTNKMFRT